MNPIPSSTSKINPALKALVGRMVGLTWSALPRDPSLLRGVTAENIVKPVERMHGVASIEHKPIHLWKIREYCIETQRLMKDSLWAIGRDPEFEKLDQAMKLNYTAVFLAGNIAYNQCKLAEKVKLPERRTDVNWKHFITTDVLWHACKPLEKMNGSMEETVRYHIENAWLNRQERPYKDYYLLRWENTAICAIEAVYQTIESLEDANDLDKFIDVCQRLQDLMVEYRLWGKDTYNSDRTYPDKTPKEFSELDHHMKENIVLLVLATLSGVGDYASNVQDLASKQLDK